MTTYSRSTLVGQPPLGSTTIMPYMPEATWSTIGGVTQWYMKTPGWVGVNSKEIVCPGPIEWNMSCGEPSAEWKSIECSIGAAMRSLGEVTLVRFVMEKRILSPTRARTVGPGTESPSVHAVYLMPGARSIRRFDASRRTSFRGLGSSGCSAASNDRLLPVAYGPERSSSTTTAGTGAAGAGSAAAGFAVVGIVASHAASASNSSTGAASSHKRPSSDVLVIDLASGN